ncbi:MAG TPA: LysR family transcriptional regulator [Gammaproteobacteria bacterium]|nr:LysR family transcriptional regulator [Gammaproteobacteria bacterium]
MDNRHLLSCMQVFVSVADSGSFSEGARRLSISQPSVSRQVNALEVHLGVRLLQRTTRRLSLTEAGRVYCEKARQILRDVDEAGQSISGFKETASGVLKIGAPLLWIDLKITPYLSEFMEQYPEIGLDIQCTDVMQDVVDEGLDLVIRVGHLIDSSYVAVTLARIRMVLCASPAYLESHGAPRSPGDLLDHNCIVYDGHDEWEFSHVCQKQKDQIQRVHVAGNINTNMVTVMLTALEQDICISLLPDLMIKEQLQEGTLVDVMPAYDINIKNLVVDRVFALYSNRKHLPAKTRAFIDFYRDKFSRTNGDEILPA